MNINIELFKILNAFAYKDIFKMITSVRYANKYVKPVLILRIIV